MIGSHSSPNDDKDWACYVDYDPDPEEELPDMEIYEDISDSLSKYMDWTETIDANYVETIVFLSITCLLLTHSLDNISDILLENRDQLHVGFGYPSGDCWHLGCLTPNGWK